MARSKTPPTTRHTQGWERTTLGHVCEKITDGVHQSVKTTPNGVPFLYVSNVRDGKIAWQEAAAISDAVYSEISRGRVPKKGGILYTVVGSYGHAALLEDDRPFSFQRHVAYLIPNIAVLMPEYLAVYLNSEFGKSTAERVALGNAQKTITLGELAKFPIAVPPIGVQEQIALILSTLDDAIDATKAVIKQTRKLNTALLQDLLTNGLPGRHTEFANVKGLGRVPKDWKIARLDEIATVARGKFTHRPRNDPRFYGGGIPFVQTGDLVGSGDYLRAHSQTLNEDGLRISRMFPKGTVLFAIAASVGACTIASYDVAFPDSIVGMTPGKELDPLYLLRMMRIAKRRMLRTATESAQANLSLELLCPMQFAVPTLAEQRDISKAIRGVEERTEAAELTLKQLAATKAALSQGLLSGRIPVRGAD